jgi:hypothetical protein
MLKTVCSDRVRQTVTARTNFSIYIGGEYAGSIMAANAEMAVRRWRRLYGRGFAGGDGIYPEIKAVVSD